MGKKERKKKQQRSSRLAQREHRGQWAQSGSRSAADRGLERLERTGPQAMAHLSMILGEVLWDELPEFHFRPEEVEELDALVGPPGPEADPNAMATYMEYTEQRRDFQDTSALREALQALLPRHQGRPEVVEAIETLLALLQVEPATVWGLFAAYSHLETMEEEDEWEEEDVPVGWRAAPGPEWATAGASPGIEYDSEAWLRGLQAWARESAASPEGELDPALRQEVQRPDSPLRLPPELLLFAASNWQRRSEAGRAPDDFSDEDWSEWLESVLFETDLEFEHEAEREELGEAVRRRARAFREKGHEEIARGLDDAAQSWTDQPPDETPLLLAVYLESLLQFGRTPPADVGGQALHQALHQPDDRRPPVAALRQLAAAGQPERARRLLTYLQATQPEVDWTEAGALLEQPDRLQKWLEERLAAAGEGMD